MPELGTPTPLTQPEPQVESALTRRLRRFFRWYRDHVRFGHPLLRRALRATMRRHQQVVLRSGLRMELDLAMVVQHTIFWYDGHMEPQCAWAVREFLPVGGTLIDCGANCGFIGLEARLHKVARVIFMEPHPVLAATIRRNLVRNGWQSDCRVIEAAASDRAGAAPLYLCASYDGSHSLLPDWWKPGDPPPSVQVKLVTLKDVLQSEPGWDRVDFLKVDTEGHDLSVLRGLADLLCPGRVRVLYAELGRNRQEAARLLRERGYEGFCFRGGLFRNTISLRRAVAQMAEGRPLALFTPLEGNLETIGETLWCPRGGPEARHVKELSVRCAALEES